MHLKVKLEKALKVFHQLDHYSGLLILQPMAQLHYQHHFHHVQMRLLRQIKLAKAQKYFSASSRYCAVNNKRFDSTVSRTDIKLSVATAFSATFWLPLSATFTSPSPSLLSSLFSVEVVVDIFAKVMPTSLFFLSPFLPFSFH